MGEKEPKGKLWKNEKIGANEEINLGDWCELLPEDKVRPVTVEGLGPPFSGHVIGKDKILGHDVIYDGTMVRGVDKKWEKK